MAGKIIARGSLYNSYSIAVLYGAWALVTLGFKAGFILDTPTPQRAAALAVVTYWTSLAVFVSATVVIVVARWRRWRYAASFAASLPPIYELWIYVAYPLSHPPLTINYLGLVLWAWLLPMVVLLVHWEHERLEWIAAGRGDPILVEWPRPQGP